MKISHSLALAALGFVAASAFSAPAASAADCGHVSIAEMNWASAELLANIDKIILENGYGCDVEKVPGATETTFASMNEKGEPDIAPELWVNAFRVPLDKALKEGRLHALNPSPITGLGEGWWVSESFAKAHPEIDTVEKMLKHPDLVPDAEDPSKGAFMGCPAGWGCQLNNANLFRAFKMEDKGWKLVDPGSAAGLDAAIAKAYNRKEPWFGYYWTPTAVVGKYHLHFLPFETKWAGKDNWDNCITKAEQDCADPKPTSWTKSAVDTVVTDKFFKAGGPAIGYLKQRVFPGDAMNAMLVYMADKQATGEDAAYYFLSNHEDIWTKWVPDEVAKKVKAAL